MARIVQAQVMAAGKVKGNHCFYSLAERLLIGNVRHLGDFVQGRASSLVDLDLQQRGVLGRCSRSAAGSHLGHHHGGNSLRLGVHLHPGLHLGPHII